jgi:hypothetical protein
MIVVAKKNAERVERKFPYFYGIGIGWFEWTVDSDLNLIFITKLEIVFIWIVCRLQEKNWIRSSYLLLIPSNMLDISSSDNGICKVVHIQGEDIVH